MTHLVEPVSVANLRKLASCPASEHWCPSGTGVSLRTVIMDILLCCDKNELCSYWEEEKSASKGRRYSKAADVKREDFARAKRRGANPGFIGRSLFALPGYIRNLARSELKGMWVLDLVNAHPTIMHRRHPSLQHLARYVEHREEALASIPCGRAAAKELFIRLLYGGCVGTWCREFGVDRRSLPPFVSGFEADMRKIIELDGRGKTPYTLNTEAERKAVDDIEALLLQRGAVIHAYEHDGLCFSLDADPTELVQACSSACGYRVTVEPTRSYEQRIEAIRQKSGIHEWEPTDTDWEQRAMLIARGRAEPLTSHKLFADIVLTEPRVSDDIPWPITELFLLCPASRELMWYDPRQAVWHEAAGGNGSVLLKDYITIMLQRRVTTYTVCKEHRFNVDEVRHDFGNRCFRDGVEACLRSRLAVAPGFALDPESSRRYINFCGQAWDRETETFVPTAPSMHISRTTAWRFEGYENDGKGYLDEALWRTRQEQDLHGLDKPSALLEDTEALFDRAATTMPELTFFRQLVETWEEVVYLLTHLARGTFGIPMAEALHVKSSGRSGKDTTANIICEVLGTYSYSVAYDSLTMVASPDAPSPTFAQLRARRFVAVREVGESKMVAAVYKRFTDHNSELSGRNLYDAPVRFKPQYLAMFCSNKPMAMDMKGDAVRARTAVIEYSSVFTTNPSEANHRQWRDLSDDISAFRPAVWWMLTRVYHHLLRDRPMRNVLPVPETSLTAAELDCRQAPAGNWGRLEIQPASGPIDATMADEIEDEVSQLMGLDRMSCRLALQGRGFQRVRSKRGSANAYFYQYNFIVNGQKTIKPQYVKRRS
jgi:hypothetical protein